MNIHQLCIRGSYCLSLVRAQAMCTLDTHIYYVHVPLQGKHLVVEVFVEIFSVAVLGGLSILLWGFLLKVKQSGQE
jgi:hypothetical protein